MIWHLRRAGLRWHYHVSLRVPRHGWRQVGAEGFGVVDNYGNFFVVEA